MIATLGLLRYLAFDTSTETLSLAVSHNGQIWTHTASGGAQASATLIPAILALLAQAGLRLDELDVIAFGRGPGSFTGLRTACAVAQGLGLGVEVSGKTVQLLPVDTLLAMAEEARHSSGARRVVVVLDARMDEVYTASYDFDASGGVDIERDAAGPWFAQAAQVVKPEAVVCAAGWRLAGNAFAAYGARLAGFGLGAGVATEAIDVLPTAAAMLRLAPLLLAAGQGVRADDALPSYVRDKVASTTVERVAAKAVALDAAKKLAKEVAEMAAQVAALTASSPVATGPEVRFEPLTPRQLGAVTLIENAVYSHPWTPGNFIDAFKAGYAAQALMATECTNGTNGAKVTKDTKGEVLIGYFVAMKGVDEVHLLNLTVAPAYQRQGWARCMLDALALWSRGQGAQALWLEVRESNARAIDVYTRHGFAQVGVRKAYYPAAPSDPTAHGQRENAVVMNLKL
jgi:tRNA threonylcarbamoyladenosine biosynthesis protein TsaB